MAVSLALRNDTSVSERTPAPRSTRWPRSWNICPIRRYLPLPPIAEPFSPQPTATPIAWVSNYPTLTYWNRSDYFVKEYFDGAVQRAKEFGYHLEHFWLGESGMTPQRLSKILYTRGVSGVC